MFKWIGPQPPVSTHRYHTVQAPPQDGNRTTGNGWTTTQHKHPTNQQWGQNWPHWQPGNWFRPWWGAPAWQPPAWYTQAPSWWITGPPTTATVTTPNYGPGVYVSGGNIVYGA